MLRQLNNGQVEIWNLAGLNIVTIDQISEEFVKRYLHTKKVDLSRNKLNKLDGISCLALLKLDELDLSFNMISSIAEVEHLKPLHSLRKLNLSGNPVNLMKESELKEFIYVKLP